MKRRSLSWRLLSAMLLVVLSGAAALYLTARLLGPELFDTEVQRLGQRYGWAQNDSSPGEGGPQGRGGLGAGLDVSALDDELADAFTSSLDRALLVAVGVGALAAIAGAAIVSRRLLRPLSDMQQTVRLMADGSYDERLIEPSDRELAELAGDVNALAEALSASEERRARLISDLAHELRTPITSIDGYLEGLEDGVFEPDDDTLTALRDETRRLRRLAADLSVLSRADEHAFDLHCEPADLGVLANRAARSMSGRFAAEGVTLEVADDIPPLPIEADIDRIGQVFSNLLSNVFRHTPPGGTVRVAGVARGNEVVVTVTDTGDGISAEDLSWIFERFYRGRGKDDSGGSGIGLTIARSIARAHGGDLTASSEGDGSGATFVVTVPLRD